MNINRRQWTVLSHFYLCQFFNQLTLQLNSKFKLIISYNDSITILRLYYRELIISNKTICGNFKHFCLGSSANILFLYLKWIGMISIINWFFLFHYLVFGATYDDKLGCWRRRANADIRKMTQSPKITNYMKPQ